MYASLVSPLSTSLFTQGIEWGTQLTVAEAQCRLSVARIRADNSLRGAVFPVALFSPAGRTVFGAAVECSSVASGDGPPPPSAISASLSLWRNRRGGVLCIKRAEAGMAPLALFAEEQAIRKLVAFAVEAVQSSSTPAVEAANALATAAGATVVESGRRDDRHGVGVLRQPDTASASSALFSCGPDLSGLAVGLPSSSSSKASPRRLQLYIEHLRVLPLKLSLSFVPAPWHQSGEKIPSKQATGKSLQQPPAGSPGDSGGSGSSGLVRLALSLAHLEGAWVQLRGLELRHPLLAPNALAQVVVSYYVKCVYRVAGPSLYALLTADSVH